MPQPYTPGMLTVLMPIYNEKDNLLLLLKTVMEVPVEKELIIVDDASTDGTKELLLQEVDGKYPNVRVFYHEQNQGKGAALRTAIPYARGEFSIVQDGDLEYDPQDYRSILSVFKDPEVNVVYGSRFLNGRPSMRPANRFINWLLPLLVRILYGASITDEATCYKAFRTKILQSIPLTCSRFEFCPEVTAKLIRRGEHIVETPISYAARSFSQGKKIRWTDGVEAIWTLIKFRFSRRK